MRSRLTSRRIRPAFRPPRPERSEQVQATITVLPGDGIGPEVAGEAVRVLRAVAERWDHRFEFRDALLGGIAIDETGTALPEETTRLCKEADAVLLGAV